MQRRRRERKGGGRPKGGAVKSIDPTKQDSFEIRRRLHAGCEPIRNKHALLFIHWRNLRAQHDDCAQLLRRLRKVAALETQNLKMIGREL